MSPNIFILSRKTKIIDLFAGEILARCGCASAEVVDEVVKDASEAQKSWAALNVQERGAVLRRAASIIRVCSLSFSISLIQYVMKVFQLHV